MKHPALLLALLSATALAAAPSAGPAPVFRNRDNPVANDPHDGLYPVPYHKPAVEEITAALGRMRAYLEEASPTRVIDEDSGREITDFSRPLESAIADRGDHGAFNPWQYVMGVIHAGMLHAAEVLQDERYANFVARHLRFIHDRLPYFRAQAELVGVEPGAEYRGHGQRLNSFRGAIFTETLDDSGAMGAALVKARLAGVGPDNLALINHLADFVSQGQFRLEDGCWARRRPQPVSLWADDYYMSVPFMAQMSRLTGDARYIDDAANHVLRAAARLFNPATRLFTHGWNADQPYNPQFYWGRANGWVMMALVELLDVMPADHRRRPEILDLLQRHIQGICSLQSPEGLWHNLLDKTDSYPESSCTAMFVYSIAHAINEGWVSPASFGSVAQAGWNGLSSRITEGGQIRDTCVGTTFASDNVYYYHRPTSLDATHGLGPAIMAGAEMIRLLKNDSVEIKYQWRTYHYIPK